MIKLAVLVVGLVVIASASLPSIAGGQVFTDPVAFAATLGTISTHDYDSLPHNQTIGTQLSGANYQSTARAWDAQLFGGGGTFHTPVNVAFNFGSEPIDIVFNPQVDGVGFYNTSIFDAERATFYDSNGGILFQGDLPDGTVNFLGFISGAKIARVSVVGIAPTNGTIFIDTLMFGNAGLVSVEHRTWGVVKSLFQDR